MVPMPLLSEEGPFQAAMPWWLRFANPNKIFGFDVPAIGVQTIEVMAAVDAKVLVVEASKTIVFDQSTMIAVADRQDISIVAYKNALNKRY